MSNYDERWAGEIIAIATGALIGLLPAGAAAFKDSLRGELLENLIQSGDWKNRLKAKVPPSSETAESRKDRIDRFIAELLAHGRSVTRKDIWRVAGYTNRTEFERFQRYAKPENKSATRKFDSILNLTTHQFISRLERVVSP